MGRRKLSEEERIKSREKRLEYLKKYRKEHGPDYYKENRERILKHQRDKREQEKGSPLNSHNKVNLKNMTKEERNEYYKIKNRESRARKKEKEIKMRGIIKNIEEEKVILKPLKIKSISLMEGVYEDAEYAGTIQDFIHNVSNEKLINIYQNGQSIWLNTDYIMSFEI